VDFNIHPAKKEAKIKNIAEVRQKLTEVLDSFLRQLGLHSRAAFSGAAGVLAEVSGASPQGLPFAETRMPPGYPLYEPGWYSEGAGRPAANGHELYSPPGGRGDGPVDLILREAIPSFAVEKKYDVLYRGQVFGLFLIAERGVSLYLVDQHAAHERIIYEKLAADTLAQPLLVPYEFDTDDEEEASVESNAVEIAELGIKVARCGPRRWSLAALPESYHGAEQDIVETIISRHGAAGALKKAIFANLACKKAIKDGSPLDPLSACEIIRAAFAMENPRCPHGRPLWFEISREDLFRKVGRII
jgi:DNA mismatch repair protein MutL